MGLYNVVTRTNLAGGQPEDVSVVLANFDAIAAVLNGNIEDANVKAGAAIGLPKLASTGVIGTGAVTVTATGFTLGGDTTIYRASANNLKTDGNLVVGGTGGLTFSSNGSVIARSGAVVGNPVLVSRLATDTIDRLRIDYNGTISLGPGNAASDTNLYRSGVGVLFTDSVLQSALGVYSRGGGGFNYNPASGTGVALASQIQGDAQPFFRLDYTGGMNWGAGGAGVVDTTLYRTAAGVLKTDGKILAAGEILSQGVDGGSHLAIFKLNNTVAAKTGFLYMPDSGVLQLGFIGGNIPVTLSSASSTEIAFTGKAAQSLTVPFTAPSTFSTYLELGPSATPVELQGDPSGNFLLSANGLVAGVFQMIRVGSVANTLILQTGNLGFNSTSYGSGTGVIAIGNASVVPSANPAAGGVLYTQAGALKYRGSSGTITTLAVA